MLQWESLRTWQTKLAARSRDEKRIGRIIVSGSLAILVIMISLLIFRYLPDRNVVTHMRSNTCIVRDVSFNGTCTAITWATQVDGRWYQMVEPCHEPMTAVPTIGHSQDCYYDDRDPAKIRFDGGPTDRMVSIMVLVCYFGGAALLFLVVGIMHYYGCARSHDNEIAAPVEAGPYEFMLAHHRRVGHSSSIYRHFRANRLYDRHLSGLILAHLDPTMVPIIRSDDLSPV